MSLSSICIHIVQIAASSYETSVLLKNDSTAMTDVGGPDHQQLAPFRSATMAL